MLLGTVAELMSLVTFVNQLRQIHREKYQVSKRKAGAMAAMWPLQGVDVHPEFCIAPGNSRAILLHWRGLLVLFSCLNEKHRQELIHS